MFQRSESIDIVRGDDDNAAPSRHPTPDAPSTITPSRTTSARPTGDPADVAAVVRAITPLVWQALMGLVVSYAAFTVFGLFKNHLGADVLGAGLAVVASVGIAVGMFLITRTSDKHSVRGLAAIFMILWLAITLCLVALEAMLGSQLLSAFVPEALYGLGGVIAALLAALALIPATTLPLVSHHEDPYPSSAAAVGSYIGLAAKGTGILASMFASSYFGLSQGMNPALAILCGVLLESSFLWAYFSLIKAKQKRDVFDVGMWSIAVVLFGVFIALVAVETVSTLANIQVAFLHPLADAGKTLFVCAVGLTLLLTIIVHILTSRVDVHEDIIDGNSRSLSRRMAERILGVRAGLAEIQAARFEPHPERQLQFRRAMLAKDAPAREPAIVVRAPVPAPGGDEDGPQGTNFLASTPRRRSKSKSDRT